MMASSTETPAQELFVPVPVSKILVDPCVVTYGNDPREVCMYTREQCEVDSDFALAAQLLSKDIEYHLRKQVCEITRNRNRGQCVYHFVHQSKVDLGENPRKREIKDVEITPMSCKLKEEIEQSKHDGAVYRQNIQHQRNDRKERTHLKHERRLERERNQEKYFSQTKPPPSYGQISEKSAARLAYYTSLWSRKLERNKQHALHVYAAQGQNKKFVAPLSWDTPKPKRNSVPPQKVPPQDLPPCELQADEYDEQDRHWTRGNTPECLLFEQVWPAMCQHIPTVTKDSALRLFESIILLGANLKMASNWTHVGVILLAWVHATYSGPMLPLLTTLLRSVLDEVKCHFKSQSEETLLGRMKEAFRTWNSVVNGDVIARIKKIIAILVAAGVCTFANLSFSETSWEAFYAASGVKSLSSVDMVTQVFDTILFMWERGLAWFTTGQWRSFFMSDSLPVKFEREYAFLLGKLSLLENGLLTQIGVEESEFLLRVETLHEQTVEYLRTVSTTMEKKILQDKLLNVERLKSRVFECFRLVTMRRKPYVVLLFGATNIGKTITTATLMNGIAKFCGIPSGIKHKVSLNPADKYQSEVKSHHSMYVIDDIANIKVEYAEGNVSDLLIKVANNEPKYALKADVSSKGQVLMSPLLVFGSTNVKDIDSEKLSNCPTAVMRRIDAIVTPKVRPEYALPNHRGFDVDKSNGLVGEYCTFTVERTIPNRMNPEDPDRINVRQDTVAYQVIEYHFEGEEKPRPLRDISYHDLLVYLSRSCKAHLEKQARLIAEVENIHEKELCEHGSYSEVCPKCAHIREELEDVDVAGLQDQSLEVCKWASNQYKSWFGWSKRLLHCVPECIGGKWAMVYERVVSKQTNTLQDYVFVSFVTSIIVSVPFFSVALWLLPVSAAFCLGIVVQTYVLLSALKARFSRTVRALASAPFDLIAGVVRKHALTGPLVAFGALIGVVMYARRLYTTVAMAQQAFPQTSEEKVPEKDKVQRINHWKPVYVSKPPVDPRVRTATTRQVCELISDKLCRIVLSKPGARMACNALPLQSNVWLVPYHVTQRGYEEITISRCPPGMVGPTFTARIGANVIKRVGNTDLAVVYIPAGGSQANLMHLFPDGYTQGRNAAMCIYKREDGSILMDQVNTVHRMYPMPEEKINALEYVMAQPTFAGLCMATLVAMGKVPYIMGFHIGGYELDSTTGKPTAEQIKKSCTGVSMQVTRQELQDSIDVLFTECVIAVKVADESTMVLDVDEKNVHLQGELHYKSPLNYLEHEASVTTFGSHTGRLRAFKSDCIPSHITKEVEQCFGVPNNFGPPHKMNSYEPWRADVLNLTSVQDLPPEVVELAYLDLRTKVFSFLKESDKERIHPYTWDVAMAGADGVYGVEGLNRNTSTGWPGNDKKWKILTPSARQVKGISRPLDMPEGMQERLEAAEEKFANGERMYFVHRANLKDEPTRIDKTKVRVFAGSPVELSMLFRKYFLAICKYIMEHPIEFECAVGVNAHGPEWSRLIEAMTKYGTERMIAGDYKAFDSTMCAMISLLGFKLMIEIAAWAGYTSRQLTIMLGIATEICYPLYEYNGEFDMYNGGNPSGHGGTVFINNFAGSLYYRVAYYLLTPLGSETPLMHEVVSFIGYGDDNGCSVQEGYGWFNHTSISHALGQFGVVYTMADKTSESVPYITLDEIEFLKRKPVWSDEFQLYMAPLKEASILKSLHCVKKSKVLSPEEHAAACIVGAVSEYFQYGESVYTDRINKLRRVVQLSGIEAHLPEARLPDYHEMKHDYLKKYVNPSCGESVNTVLEVDVKHLQQQAQEVELAPDAVQLANEWLIMLSQNQRLQMRRAQYPKRRACTACSLNRTSGHSLPTLHRISRRWCEVRDARSTMRVDMRVQHVPGYTTALSLHSGEQDRFTETENQTYSMSALQMRSEHQNLVFRDGAPQWGVGLDSAMDSTRMVATHDDVSLGEFLSRPVQIASYNWTPGTTFIFTQMDPWSLFFGQKRVINRICNYALMQPKQLHVKVQINGTSFHYGKLLVHYTPLPNSNTTDNVAIAGRFTNATERMHLTIDPTTSQAGQFALPFIWPYNALNVVNSEWNQLGLLTFEELVPLKHANGGTIPINITIYAWAEDVKLSIPTTLDPNTIIPQADEYGVGAVGRVASAVSKASGALSGVPGIAPFAKATGMVAGAMGSIAKAYGFSRPPIVTDLTNVRPTLVGTMANTDRGDTSVKLTVDSKQELTIDPRVFGVDTGDELVLTNLAGKQAYLTQFLWTTAASTGALLWNVRVNPMMNQLVPNAGYCLLPCAFAALPFHYWRGTIRYRFQIVASSYHKGRLKFTYDPYYVGSTDTNVAYIRIVDLADERDFTIDVAWSQPQTWLGVPALPYTQANGTTVAITNSDTVLCNGVLSCSVLNDLTTPNDVPNNDISIVVYASMCDDCEFNVLDNSHIEGLTFKNQAEEIHDDGEADMQNAPLDIDSKECMSECLPVDQTLSVYFGESITSFRTALKRYNYHASYRNAGTGQTHWQLIMRTFPDYPGVYTTGINVAATVPAAGTVVNFAKLTLMNYLTPAFLAQRGGIRLKYNFFSDLSLTTLYQSVGRYTSGNPVPATFSNANGAHLNTNNSVFTQGRLTEYTGGQQGLEVTYGHAQPTLEVEIPYYNQKRFDSAKDPGYTQSGSGTLNLAPSDSHIIDTQFNSTAYSGVDKFVAAGEDFQLFLFQGLPPIYVQTFT